MTGTITYPIWVAGIRSPAEIEVLMLRHFVALGVSKAWSISLTCGRGGWWEMKVDHDGERPVWDLIHAQSDRVAIQCGWRSGS